MITETETVKPSNAKISNYVTAHCSQGNCEGTANKSISGAVYQACKGVYKFNFREGGTVVCTHNCHKVFAEIRALIADMPGNKAIVDLPVPPVAKGNLFLPEPHTIPVSALSVPLNPSQAPMGTPAPPAGMASKVFTPTSSGRAARGELEEQVRVVLVAAWRGSRSLVETVGLSPKAIAVGISKDKPPSQGAVYAVLTRWSSKNWVILEDKPFRTKGFTGQGEQRLVY